MVQPKALCLLAALWLAGITTHAQSADSVSGKLLSLPSRWFGRIQSKAAGLDQQITRSSEKYLQRLAKKEDQLRRKLFRQDSAAALRVFGNNPMDYSALLSKLQQAGAVGGVGYGNVGSGLPSGGNAGGNGGSVYLPYMDSIKTSLKFLQQNKGLLSNGAQLGDAMNTSLAQVGQLQSRMQVAEWIRQQISLHKQALQQSLSQYAHLPPDIQGAYQGYSQQAYYYGAQLKAYTAQFSDPDQLTKKALGLLNQRPDFQSFMKTHSDLAGLFSLPGGGNTPQALAGLQTKAGVQQQLQGKVAAAGPDGQAMIQQNIQSAKTKLKAWQDKVAQAGGGNSAMEVPDFRPNTQKTKTLWGRLQYGLNFQSLPSTYVFPATSDIGASIGYKLNDRNLISIGASYKMGWGKDIQHISISGQGVGLRSSMETKIKGSFSAYGGFEYNYQQIIYNLTQLRNLNYWTRSGLVGVTKQYHISNKVKGELQLLWDFLSYQQVPKTQPILFRVGYNF
jgi:hypothetical protein